jgi:hypothetical protein
MAFAPSLECETILIGPKALGFFVEIGEIVIKSWSSFAVTINPVGNPQGLKPGHFIADYAGINACSTP